jgi:hypothetical protein
MRVGNMFLTLAEDGGFGFAISDAMLSRIRDRCPDAVVVSSPTDINTLLAHGLQQSASLAEGQSDREKSKTFGGFLYACNQKSQRSFKNPVTGEIELWDSGLTAVEQDAVNDLLLRMKASEPDGEGVGRFLVEVPDGGSAEIVFEHAVFLSADGAAAARRGAVRSRVMENCGAALLLILWFSIAYGLSAFAGFHFVVSFLIALPILLGIAVWSAFVCLLLYWGTLVALRFFGLAFGSQDSLTDRCAMNVKGFLLTFGKRKSA